LCKAVEVLDVAAVANEVPPEYGETEWKLLCKKFGLGFNEAKNAYRDFKESGSKVIADSLRKVMHFVDTIPVSTAECERGFSQPHEPCLHKFEVTTLCETYLLSPH